VPYSTCGCIPDPINSGHHNSRFVSKVLHEDSTSRTIDNPRPELISSANEDTDGSHASEHSLAIDGPSGKDEKDTVMTGEFKTERGYYTAKKEASSIPTTDQWIDLQSERKQTNPTRDSHKEQFTDPYVGAGGGAYYPYWGISMIPTFGYVRAIIQVLLGFDSPHIDSTTAMRIWDSPMHVVIVAVEEDVEEDVGVDVEGDAVEALKGLSSLGILQCMVTV